jgi:hypothetical protein
MLGLGRTSTIRPSVTASSARSRDIYQRYAAAQYRQALLSLDHSAYPRDMAPLWRAVLRRLTTSSAAVQDGDQA